jgi:hypothetical protein
MGFVLLKDLLRPFILLAYAFFLGLTEQERSDWLKVCFLTVADYLPLDEV